MVVEHISAMMVVAERRDEAFGGALMKETKVLLRRYLRPYLGPPNDETPPSKRKKGH